MFFFSKTPQLQQVTDRRLEEEQDRVLHEEHLYLGGFFPSHAATPRRDRAQPLPAVQTRMTDHYGPLSFFFFCLSVTTVRNYKHQRYSFCYWCQKAERSYAIPPPFPFKMLHPKTKQIFFSQCHTNLDEKRKVMDLNVLGLERPSKRALGGYKMPPSPRAVVGKTSSSFLHSACGLFSPFFYFFFLFLLPASIRGTSFDIGIPFPGPT